MPWEPLGAVPPGDLVAARLVLHWAAQLVASVGAALLPPLPDDSHTALTWSAGRFVGQAVEGRTTALRAHDLLLSAGERELALPGVTRADALAWLGAAFGRSGALPAYPHLPPAHPVGGDAPFPAAGDGCAELARWYANATFLLEPIAARPEAGPVRVWPHHFDIATLLDLGGGKTLGVGLSPGDASYAEPYFYVTPYPYPEDRSGPPLPVGKWHTESWFGAVLIGGEVTGADAAQAFVSAAMAACEERSAKK
jgi:hypothetical protein